jgi:hypothetical protein
LSKIVIGFLLLSVLGVWLFLGFSQHVVFMLSPFLARFVAPWRPRIQEKLADRAAVDLGYGVFLAEVFTGREFQRALSRQNAPRPHLIGSEGRDRMFPLFAAVLIHFPGSVHVARTRATRRRPVTASRV